METGVVGASGAGKWVRRRGCQAPHSNHHRHRHLFVIVAVAFFVIVIAILTIFPVINIFFVIIVFLVIDKMPAQHTFAKLGHNHHSYHYQQYKVVQNQSMKRKKNVRKKTRAQ